MRCHERHRHGFTLIEVVAVLVMMGLLVTFGFVMARSAPSQANDTNQQALLRQAAATLQMHYDTRGYFPETAGQAVQIDASVAWVDGVPASQREVSVAASVVDEVDHVGLAVALDGTCHMLRVGPRNTTAETRARFAVADGVACTGMSALAVEGMQW
jgi:prepilin-type N-terminal cleavage/methylation domain-containing protein